MQAGASSRTAENAAAVPLAELLACSPTAGSLLNRSSICIPFETGEVVFRQGEPSRGLYLVVTGTLVRKAERKNTRVTLGIARAGDLLELSAALGDECHTCTATGQAPGTLMLLPIEALRSAFESYPPLRMQLLGELAREVSRSYVTVSAERLQAMRGNHRQSM